MPRQNATAAVAPASTEKRKRPISATATPHSSISTPPTRSSKRLRTELGKSPASKPTPTKSKYFEHSEDEDEEDDSAGEEASGYEDEDASEEGEPSEASSEDEFDSEEETKVKAKRGRKPTKRNSTAEQVLSSKNDLWREGVKTGLGPGKAVYIERPKARGDGGIKYVPKKIHPHTLEFLKDLKKNNDRIWLKAHDADYRTSWKDFESFVETLSEKIAEVDETIPELPPKDLVFRIYRDVRFSSDPTPYKTHFSAAFSRTGRKGPYACYYIHIQPGGRCFVGSGLWHPDATPLAKLRTDIDERPERIRGVLTAPNLRKHVLGGVSKDLKKCVQAFCKQNEENALKTKPKVSAYKINQLDANPAQGYDADHPNIELLRLKNFTLGQKIPDEDIIGPNGLEKVLELVGVMKPFVAYLNSVVMPDEVADADGTASEASTSEDEAATSEN